MSEDNMEPGVAKIAAVELSFKCRTYTSRLLEGFSKLREKGHLIDVTFIAEGRPFYAHRSVLAASSDYFRAMFTDEMREAREQVITLNGVSAAGLDTILKYAYSSTMVLNLGNVQDILAAASHVQMQDVVCACSNFLQNHLDLENCVDIATIAETFSLKHLKQIVYQYISSQLLEFSCTIEFLQLAPQQLQCLLSSDYPVNCAEIEVVHLVLKWLRNVNISTMDSENLGYVREIISHIHFNEISFNSVELIYKDIYRDKDTSKQIVRKMLYQEAVRQNNVANPKLQASTYALLNYRGMEEALIKVGGFSNTGVTNEITYCILKENRWHTLSAIPHLDQCNYGTVVYQNLLYVIGGSFNQALQEFIHPFGFKYNPSYNTWSAIEPMLSERCRFALNVMEDKLYATGGANDLDEFNDVSTCEYYDPARKKWNYIAPLHEYRTQHSGAAIEIDGNNYLFISGGLEGINVLNSVYCYTASTNVWEMRAPMLTARVDHICLSIYNRLYVCGGWHDETDTGNRVLVDTIDVYDPETNSWRTVTKVPTPRFHAGITNVGSKIYFVGGFTNMDVFERDKMALECYDIETNTWITMEKYPSDIWEHTCVVLHVPRARPDIKYITNEA